MAETTYPRIPDRSWWTLRERFKQSLPSTSIDSKYLSNLLTVGEDTASNLLPPLRQLGILDEENRPSDLANDWRNDQRYADACQTMLEATYPPTLLEQFSEKNPDKKMVQDWFQYEGKMGSVAARMCTVTFLILKDAVPKSDADKPKTPTRNSQASKKSRAATKEKKPAKNFLSTAPDEQITEDNTSTLGRDTWSRQNFALHVDINIHLSADSSTEQIDQIFASIAKHLSVSQDE